MSEDRQIINLVANPILAGYEKRIAELEAENELIDGQMRRLRLDVAQLETQLAEAQRDAARYRKIETDGLTISYRKKGVGVHKPMTNYPYELHKTLADAVDAAMQKDGSAK